MSGHVWSIAAHELRLAWRNRSITALGAVIALLAAASVIVGQARYDAEQAQRERYQAVVAGQFEDQPDRHPHRVSHYGYLVFRPRAPLGFFDSGLESFAGTSIFLEAHRQNSANFSSASQGGGTERFGELTLASVLQLFLPLLVFAVAGVSVTREREGGTLPLLLCQGASWRQVLWGKWLGALIVVGAVAGPGVSIAAVWLALQTSGWDADVAARAGWLAVSHLVFLGTCAAIAVCVSAWQATSRGALVVLVGLWFALWIVLPRVLPSAAAAWYPVPARAAFDAEVDARVKELGDSHNPNDPVFAKLRADTLARYGVTRVEDLPINYGGLVMREGEQHTAEAFGRQQESLVATYRRQTTLVETAGMVSPYLAIRSISMALAGSDLAHLLEFERQAEAFRYTLIQALNDLHITTVSYAEDRYGAVVNGAPTRQRIDASHFEALPTFDYRAPGVRWALAQHPVSMAAGLLGAGLGVVLVAWTAARRPRVW